MDEFQAIKLGLEMPFYVFHMTVIYCIVRQRRKAFSMFSTTFFTIYLIQSCAELFYYPMNIVYVRLARYGYVSKELVEFPIGNMSCASMVYALYLQMVAHASIAFNRYSSLTRVSPHKSKRLLGVSQGILLLVLVPLPGAITRLCSKPLLVQVSPTLYNVTFSTPWFSLVTQITSIVYCLSTSLVSLYYDMKTLVIYLKFSAIKKRKYRNDFCLLVYALMQFSVQLCMSANYACNGYGAMTENSTVLSFALATNPYILTPYQEQRPIVCCSLSPVHADLGKNALKDTLGQEFYPRTFLNYELLKSEPTN